MKVLVASTTFTGHLNPMLSIGRLLVEKGHEVVVLTSSMMKDRVEGIGATLKSFPPEFDYDHRDLDVRFPDRAALPPFERVIHDLKYTFTDPIPALHRGVQGVLREFPAEIILADSSFFGTYPMLLGPRSKRPAVITCGIMFLPWHRDDRAPATLGLPPAQNEAERAQYSAIAKAFETDSLPITRYLNECLARLGTGPIPADLFDSMVILPDVYLQLTAPEFEFPRSDLPRTVHFAGALPITPGQAPLPVWASDLDAPSKKIVLVTQGTVSNQDYDDLIVPTMIALAKEPDILVVVSAGGRPINAIPHPVPDNARLASYLPMEWLLPKVDVLVTNGGYGTVNQALTFGIPIVVAGQTEDKADVGARIAWSGVGIDLKANRPTSPSIRQAVRELLDRPQHRATASSIARVFARIDTRTRILRAVEEAVAMKARA